MSEIKLCLSELHGVPYLNEVHVVHPIQVIPRKNQHILNILAPCILWNGKHMMS